MSDLLVASCSRHVGPVSRGGVVSLTLFGWLALVSQFISFSVSETLHLIRYRVPVIFHYQEPCSFSRSLKAVAWDPFLANKNVIPLDGPLSRGEVLFRFRNLGYVYIFISVLQNALMSRFQTLRLAPISQQFLRN